MYLSRVHGMGNRESYAREEVTLGGGTPVLNCHYPGVLCQLRGFQRC